MGNCFPNWLYLFTFPEVVCGSLNCFTFLPVFGMISYFNFSHSKKYLIPCCFNLNFSGDYWFWASFHVCHEYISFGDMKKSLADFVLDYLSYYLGLQVLNMFSKNLYQIYDVQIFSPSLWLEVLNIGEVQLIISLQVLYVWHLWLNQDHKHFLLCFLLHV